MPRRLTADQCASLLAEANRRRLIASRPVADSEGSCPLRNVVRVANFGSVQLSSSFLASCPLALSSALYIEQQAKPADPSTRWRAIRARSIISAASPVAIFTIVNRRGAVNTPRRTRWTSAASAWRTADASASCRAGGARLRAPGWRWRC